MGRKSSSAFTRGAKAGLRIRKPSSKSVLRAIGNEIARTASEAAREAQKEAARKKVSGYPDGAPGATAEQLREAGQRPAAEPEKGASIATAVWIILIGVVLLLILL
jgi:hypothetical protein